MNKKALKCLLVLVIVGSQMSWAHDKNPEIPHMTVNGEATLFKPADQMELLVDVLTEGKEVKKAVEENNRMIGQTLTNLKKVGLTEGEYHTNRYQVNPVYQISEKDKQNHQMIDHYEVHHTIAIKTQKLDLKDAIIGAVVEGGANQITSLTFNNFNPQSYREEAIAQAAKNALSNAHALAIASKVKVVRLLSVAVEQLYDQSKSQMPRMAMAKMSPGNAYEPSINEGPVEIFATVSMVLEISSKEN